MRGVASDEREEVEASGPQVGGLNTPGGGSSTVRLASLVDARQRVAWRYFLMKLAMKLGSLVILSFFAAACSSSDDASDKTGPVAASPLKGTIEGKDFVGKTALAKKGFDPGEKSIDIYDTDVKCDEFGASPPRSILISVPWSAGTSKDFKFALGEDGQTATFVIQRDDKTDNIVSTQGRVEILEAPTEKGATGKMRLRAVAKDNSVEGEISVQVCD